MTRFLLLLPLVLSACVAGPGTAPSGPAAPPSAGDACGASGYSYLVGREDTALERVLIIGQVRVIRPDTAHTDDFRPERINFRIDRAGRIASVTCG